MDVEAYRDFRLLTEIASDVSVTQRGLAKKFGLALGLTNFLIRRLVRKGYIKIITLERKRLRYLLTPTGLAARAKLSYDYLEYSLHLYRAIRTFLVHVLSGIVTAHGTRAVLIGTGEVAEIAFLIMQQRGVHIVAVLDESRRGAAAFMSQPVKPLGELPKLSYDWVVVASFQETRHIRHRLAAWGVPREKIITIPEGQAFPETTPETLRAAPEMLVEAARP